VDGTSPSTHAYFYKADRVRHQTNASHAHASGFAGIHLQVRRRFERSYVRAAGLSGGRHIASYGVPYGAVYWDGYLKDNVNGRFSAYAGFVADRPQGDHQSGLRWDHYSGFNSTWTSRSSPPTRSRRESGSRSDVAGNGKTVLEVITVSTSTARNQAITTCSPNRAMLRTSIRSRWRLFSRHT
jgi:hypothetical protein